MVASILRRLAGPLLGAAAALAAIAAADAFAGSGINGVFNLGVSNTVDAQTQLSGNSGGNPQLRVDSSSSDAGAIAIFGKIGPASAGADSAAIRGVTASTNPSAVAVVGKNFGGGPALKADVQPGAPPLAVNSSTKVVNLNADRLDGHDSADLDPSSFVVTGSPWDALSFSGGTSVALALGPKATITATTVGVKTIVLPLPNVDFGYGGTAPFSIDHVQVCYSVSSPGAGITSTVLKSGNLGQAQTVFSDSSTRSSTSPECYVAVSSSPIFVSPHSLYIQLSVTFSTPGQSIKLYSFELTKKKP